MGGNDFTTAKEWQNMERSRRAAFVKAFTADKRVCGIGGMI